MLAVTLVIGSSTDGLGLYVPIIIITVCVAGHYYYCVCCRALLLLCVLQGITIKPLVRLLSITLAPEKNQSMYCELNSHVSLLCVCVCVCVCMMCVCVCV